MSVNKFSGPRRSVNSMEEDLDISVKSKADLPGTWVKKDPDEESEDEDEEEAEEPVPVSTQVKYSMITEESTFKPAEYKEVIIPQSKSFPITKRVAKEIVVEKKKVLKFCSPEAQLADGKELKDLVIAAKKNKFEHTLAVLRQKPHLINGIPVDMAWSALHQAVYFDNTAAVEMLLKNPNCDVKIRAKRNKAGTTMDGENPLDIAKTQEMKNLLKQKVSQSSVDEVPTYVEQTLGDLYREEGLPLFILSTSFLLQEIMDKILTSNHSTFSDLVSFFYKLLQSNFKEMRNSIAETLYPLDSSLCSDIKDASSFDKFCALMIRVYTSNHVYRQLNVSLRRSAERRNPSGDDCLLSLYAFVLETIVLHWNKLESCNDMTYRYANLTPSDCAKYTTDKVFTWMSFTSSSLKPIAKFGNVRFEIDNNVTGASKGTLRGSFKMSKKAPRNLFLPRNIEKFSNYQKESERLYPAGAKFRVVEQVPSQGPGYTIIRLKLLD